MELCSNCDAPLQAPLIEDCEVTCPSCKATLVLRSDGDVEVTPADGETFEVPAEELAARE